MDERLNVHFVLKYQGIRFNNPLKDLELDGLSALERFAFWYSNLGAIVMRYNLTFSQRASALQQLVEADYAANPVEAYAPGDDETSLFNCPVSIPNQESAQCNYYLEANAHLSIGRSKVSNEKMRRLVQHNKKPTHGEQKLWDIMHCPVWTVGIEFHAQLHKQGFIYICCPPGITPDERANIDQQLTRGDFDKDLKWVKCHKGQKLKLDRIDQVSIFFDDLILYTQEANQIAIGSSESQELAPLGWILFEKDQAIVPQWCCEDIMKIGVLKKLGVNALNDEQKKLLFSGSLSDGPLISWKENRAFNCIYKVLLALECYPFDPGALLNSSRLYALHYRFSEALRDEPNLVDDFLTGTVQQEMIQPLLKSRPRSRRERVPERFTDSFEIALNTMKAMAYALDIRDEAGHSVLRDVTLVPSEVDGDIGVNGQFLYPSCNSGIHVAALLSTAILVAEHLFLEQLVAQAYLECVANPATAKAHPLRLFLTRIADHPDSLWSALLQLAESAPKHGDTLIPILGLRYDYCHEVLQLLREQTGLKQLIALCEPFSQPGAHTNEVLEEFNGAERLNLQTGLKHLYLLGDYLQAQQATSVQNEGSMGIHAGLKILISKLAPNLGYELGVALNSVGFATVKACDKQRARQQVSMDIIRHCPFVQGA